MTGQVTITVAAAPTPEESLAELSGDVQDLVDAAILTSGQGNALISKLDGALDKIAVDKTQSAINKLQSFINQAQALINAGTLTTDQGQALIDAAMLVITQIDA